MSFGRVMQGLTVIAGVILLVLTGCARRPEVLPIAPTDLQALRNIYDTSGAVFHGSQIDIQVQPGGTVEFEMRGQIAADTARTDDVLPNCKAI
ncbi:MAG: hypothetical protein WAL56_12850 [Candidatus Sulfotelmatobacter sp.]